MQLRIGFSPCPNDTFMFDALVRKLIDTEEFTFQVELHDVEKLNKLAFKKKLPVTKMSFHALCLLSDDYELLDSGSALGRNCGPLLISKQPIKDLSSARIAIPGLHTTANFLLHYYLPNANTTAMLFSDIEQAVVCGDYDAGVIIHENRFTYKDKGLMLLQDLGEYWESNTKHPIPLGGIAVQKSLPNHVKQAIQRILRRSISYAFQNKKPFSSFILDNAQEMQEDIIEKHIDLYVNKYSLQLGKEGRQAIEHMMNFINSDKKITIIS